MDTSLLFGAVGPLMGDAGAIVGSLFTILIVLHFKRQRKCGKADIRRHTSICIACEAGW